MTGYQKVIMMLEQTKAKANDRTTKPTRNR